MKKYCFKGSQYSLADTLAFDGNFNYDDLPPLPNDPNDPEPSYEALMHAFKKLSG